ncbi:protein-disulfide reductase DsbD family protein [Terriglobus saanensis]|uniref:Protein-disulfide reductase n=1 Tax=Terriglobus saanensis (strain ATCC BAA-1853 / DSM 23119 / SP1PR4) TaxID=401053 RepID=E8V0V5_TERSS|nr:thioredoxin family protein [Terriglobus saanensis]ADV82246.1 Protein-disulfide reductase [Terriglobus saanensis SP1PR4]
MRFFRPIVASVLFALGVGAQAGSQITAVGNGGPGPFKADHLTVELIASQHEIAQGGEVTLGLVFTLEEHWHVYWKNAGDSGEPPKAVWTVPHDLTVDELRFPAPQRLPLAPLMDFGYEDAVTFPITVHAAKNAKLSTKPIHLTAKVDWLVCSNRCLPGKANLGIDLKIVPAVQAERVKTDSTAAMAVGPLASALSHLPKPLLADFRTEVVGTPKEFVLTFHTGTKETDGEFYPFVQDQILNAADQETEPLDDGIRIHIQRSPDLKELPKTLHGLVKLSDDESYEIDSPIKPGTAAPKTSATSATPSNAMGALTAIGLAFLGGIILNLMPCVFPVLFLKALALVKNHGAERKEALRHGLVYTLGIVVSFWAILAILLALRAGGSELGWGFQMQSPGFVSILAIFLFFFSLSLAGMFDLGLSLTSAGGGLAQKEGYAGSFFTGVLATVVATPCTAPLMGAAIGFALTQPTWITFAIFTSLALGLASPYLILSARPEWTKILPRPGAWMETLKQLTSVPLFGTVIWLSWLYAKLFPSALGIDNLAWLLVGLLVVAIAGWVLYRWPAGWKSTLVAALIAVFAASVPFLMREKPEAHAVWQPYSHEAIAAARAAHHPVFVDFTAAWCLSCQVNERLVLNSTDVQERFHERNVTLLKADWTQYDPAITAELAAVHRNGVPTYVVYPADAAKEPEVLPEVLSKDIVVSALDRNLK